MKERPEPSLFRPAIRSLGLAIFGAALPLFLSVVLWQEGLHPKWIPLAGTLALMALVALLAAWVLHRLCPTRVSTEGISAFSVWGARRSIRWEDIAAARPIRIFNLTYLRLDSAADRQVTWVAMFAAAPSEFRHAVRSAMPPDSPIAPHFPADP